ncbi:unnamed protein product [Adineta steineri]|uniref:Uncharacterized protein n=1 Tax=Adineta steineri TaxID=433720 RepID=A0A818TIV3_9BILA|nr:unnamed protein product [Adineta steineri]CAF1089986.1 unnamed protein product [Adineta steineri]CAF3683979.1 unnamed protein product [Adineta steineri]
MLDKSHGHVKPTSKITKKIKICILHLLKGLLSSPVTFFKSSCSIIYIILFIIVLLILNGQPKSIFPPKAHIPWLTNVHHVQPLECIADTNQPGWPRPVLSNDKSDMNLTVVIVSARPEFKRLPVTMAALLSHLDSRRITEVMFLVPPQDVHLLQPYFSSEQVKSWPWRISVISDDILLKHIHTGSYRLQMMFKLFVAQIVKTEYYLILDSDCVAVWPIHVEQLLHQNKNSSLYRAINRGEGRSSHEKWWSESERLLQIKLESCVSYKKSDTDIPTIGVTPSILARTIALRTLCRLQKLYGDEHFLNKMANWALWREIFGYMWTEYTLYFLTGRCTKIFDTYHTDNSALSSSNSIARVELTGFSIWSHLDWTVKNQNKLIESIKNGLRWRQKEIAEANGQAITDKSTSMHNLFTVLQGRHNVDPKLYHQYFYPIYIKYLQQQKQSDKLILTLNNMTRKLVINKH